MLLSLPLLHATLLPCAESWAAMSTTPDGRYCSRCEHTVHDFSQAADPAFALAAARAASPTGRVCGRFAATQVARPRLSDRLRRFVVAQVLVFGLGLPAHEALAQVRRAGVKPLKISANRPQRRPAGNRPATQLAEVSTIEFFSGDIGPEFDSPQEGAIIPLDTVLTYAEQMPALPGGTHGELRAYIQRQARWPAGFKAVGIQGRVFVQFVVGRSGLVRDVKVLKGLEPTLDAEAVRVVRALGRLQPGRQQGRLVAVSLTVAVSFNRE